MSSSLIANRYAKAILKLTEANPGLADEALAFAGACDELFALPETRRILKSPVMPADLKKSLLAYACEASKAGPELLSFAQQVVEAGRTSHLPEISKSIRRLLDEKRGIAQATTTTAEPMTDAQKGELSGALEKVFKKKIVMKNEINKKVLGGFVVNIGNYTIDLSLKSRLNSVADYAQR
jgi:F-type H+-transporting ATPase subunit delta